jgi:hypothetical protein
LTDGVVGAWHREPVFVEQKQQKGFLSCSLFLLSKIKRFQTCLQEFLSSRWKKAYVVNSLEWWVGFCQVMLAYSKKRFLAYCSEYKIIISISC